MPKAIAIGDEKLRRRPIKIEPRRKVKPPRGLAMRILLYSPKDTVAAAVAFTAIVAILGNALLLQAGHHPSPMFGGKVTFPLSAPAAPVDNPMPRPRPLDADGPQQMRSGEAASADTKPEELSAHVVKPADAPHANAARHTASAPAAAHRDPLGDLIVSSRRIAGVQRALTRYGYGQLKPSGTVGPDTASAIQKFERERKLPVTGQISDRLVRELSAMTGHSID